MLTPVLAVVCLLAAGVGASKPCYDHQDQTYKAQFKPTSCRDTCDVTPFFSPDHSIDAYVQLIEEAEDSIDLLEPDFKSWSKCTQYSGECGGKCVGCSVEDQRKENFTVFPALINAVHRGVAIRFLTNDFHVPTCENMTTPMDWMFLNKIDIKLYKTTTFQHAKFMIIDKGKKTLISSVNFSYTSFCRNREAGVILSNCDCSVTDLYQKVFNSDWSTAYDYKLSYKYSDANIKAITDTSKIPYTIPHYTVPGAFVTRMTTITDVTIVVGYTAPDYARDTFMSTLDGVKDSLRVHIYQITDNGICDKLLDLHNNGVNVSILAGSYIVSYRDYDLAQQCYGKLYKGGMNGKIQKTYTKFSFSHQKYWVIDDSEVHLSTGNWSPSDFPTGDTFPPYSQAQHSVNRDILIGMKSDKLVAVFMGVFGEDWDKGEEWQPKTV